MSVTAVFIALGGSSYAAIQVTGKNVKNSSLTGKDVKNNSLTGSDVKSLRSSDIANGSLLASDFKAGQLPAGARGLQGIQGAPGISDTEIVEGSSTYDSATSKSAPVTCPAGKKAVSGGASISAETAGAPVALTASEPATGGPGPLTATWTASGAETATYTGNWQVYVLAICARVAG